jgi:hypothetical protein
MAQTTGGISFVNCKVEFSTNGSSWTDVSGFASTIDLGGGARATGEAYTFDGLNAIVRRGKAESYEITVEVIYTEGAGEAYALAKAAYENGTDLYVRWSPKGGTSGNKQFATSPGIVTDPPYPKGEAGSGDPVLISVKLKCTTITESTVS